MAWMQVNLINIHIPKGKTKLTLDKIRPKHARRRKVDAKTTEELEAEVEWLEADEGKRRRLAAQRSRARAQAEETRAYLASPEGRKLLASLRELHDGAPRASKGLAAELLEEGG